MNPLTNHSDSGLEERFEAWLASQPLTPAPDFVARTLARIRAETALVASAKAGDDAALDSLLDRWLGESPLEADFEPAQLATRTRRTARREEDGETGVQEAPRHWTIPFPAWARSAVALAAAASVALLAYFSTTGTPVGTVASTTEQSSNPTEVAQVNMDAADDSSLPAPGSEAYDPSTLSKLNDVVKDGTVLLNPDVAGQLPGVDPSDSDSAL
jgi:hypothetical protein